MDLFWQLFTNCLLLQPNILLVFLGLWHRWELERRCPEMDPARGDLPKGCCGLLLISLEHEGCLSLGSQAWPGGTSVLWAPSRWLEKETHQAPDVGDQWWTDLPFPSSSILMSVTKTHWCGIPLSLTQDGDHAQILLQHLTSALDLTIWNCSWGIWESSNRPLCQSLLTALPCGWHSIHTSSPGLGTQVKSPLGFLFIVTISGSSCNQLLCRTCEIHDPHPQNFPEPHPMAIKEDFWPRNYTHCATYQAWAQSFYSVQSLRWVLGSADVQRKIHSFSTSTLNADSNNQQHHSCAASSEEHTQWTQNRKCTVRLLYGQGLLNRVRAQSCLCPFTSLHSAFWTLEKRNYVIC